MNGQKMECTFPKLPASDSPDLFIIYAYKVLKIMFDANKPTPSTINNTLEFDLGIVKRFI